MPSIDEILLLSEEASTGERERLRLTENEAQIRYVSSGFWGIILAGAAYPLVVGLAVVAISVVFVGQAIAPLAGLAEVFVWFVFFTLLFGGLGVVTSAVTAIVSIPLVIVINRLLGNRMDPRSATVCAGSLAGYIPTGYVAAALILFGPYRNDGPLFAAFPISLGPVLAMSLGAFGAARSSAKYSGVRFGERDSKKKPLSISHLMIATALVSVVLAIGNFFGGTGFMIYVGVWCGLQTLMLFGVHLYRRCFGRK